LTLDEVLDSIKINKLTEEQFHFLLENITKTLKNVRSYSMKPRSEEEKEEIIAIAVERLLKTLLNKSYIVKYPEAFLHLILSQVINRIDKDIFNKEYLKFRELLKKQLEILEKEDKLVSLNNRWRSTKITNADQFDEEVFKSELANYDYSSLGAGINFTPMRKEAIKNLLDQIFSNMNFSVEFNELAKSLAANMGYGVITSLKIYIDDDDESYSPIEVGDEELDSSEVFIYEESIIKFERNLEDALNNDEKNSSMLAAIIYFQKVKEMPLKEIVKKLNLKRISNLSYYLTERGEKSANEMLLTNYRKFLQAFLDSKKIDMIIRKLEQDVLDIYERLFEKFTGDKYEK